MSNVQIALNHGSYTAYTRHGCRCEPCTAAATIARKKWVRARARNRGSLLIPAGPVRKQLEEIHAAGWTWTRIGCELGFSKQRASRLAVGKHRPSVHVRTAGAVNKLWMDVCGPTVKDGCLWSAQPLIDRIRARYGSLDGMANNNQRRELYRREWLPTDLAERYVDAHGWHPSEIWPDWYTRPELVAS